VYDISDILTIVNDPDASVRDITVTLANIDYIHADGRDES